MQVAWHESIVTKFTLFFYVFLQCFLNANLCLSLLSRSQWQIILECNTAIESPDISKQSPALGSNGAWLVHLPSQLVFPESCCGPSGYHDGQSAP